MFEEKDQKNIQYNRLDSYSEEQTEDKKSVANTMDIIYIKLQALGWIVLSFLIIYFTDFFENLGDDDGNRVALGFTIFFFTTSLSFLFYSIFYLPYILNIKIPSHLYAPNLIPLSCISWAAFFISLSVYYWRFYGFLSPFIILFLFMGLLYLTHFIPSLSFIMSCFSASQSSYTSINQSNSNTSNLSQGSN